MGGFTKLSALALTLALAGVPLCAAVEKRDLRSIDSHYDYIVVGGGVSGLVVAHRLSEDSDSAVLYLATLQRLWTLTCLEF